MTDSSLTKDEGESKCPKCGALWMLCGHGPELALKDARVRIAALERENADLTRVQNELHEKIYQLRDRPSVEPKEALAVGDKLAHQLAYNEYGGLLDAWWSARGGPDKCTVCNEAHAEPAPRAHLETTERLCACIPMIARSWNYCQNCGGRIPKNTKGGA